MTVFTEEGSLSRIHNAQVMNVDDGSKLAYSPHISSTAAIAC